MKDYRKPETRIKRVKDEKGERFYAQYKQIIIPHLWWEWQICRASVEDDFHFSSLEEAKDALDAFLLQSYARWLYTQYKESQLKVKKEVEYIKYPDED